jgi:hypothetical protein
VAIVWPCLLDVEAYAAAGMAVVVPRPGCPGCGGDPACVTDRAVADVSAYLASGRAPGG